MRIIIYSNPIKSTFKVPNRCQTRSVFLKRLLSRLNISYNHLTQITLKKSPSNQRFEIYNFARPQTPFNPCVARVKAHSSAFYQKVPQNQSNFYRVHIFSSGFRLKNSHVWYTRIKSHFTKGTKQLASLKIFKT